MFKHTARSRAIREWLKEYRDPLSPIAGNRISAETGHEYLALNIDELARVLADHGLDIGE